LKIVTLILFGVLFLPAPGVRGQDAEPQLSGRVTEVGSGAPIARATVELVPPFFEGNPNFQYFQSVKTDDDGNYRFMTVRPGGFFIHVTEDGFADGEYKTEADRFSTFLRFDSSDHFKGIDISMQPASAIQGLLTDKDGKPIADVMVSAVPQSQAIKNRFKVASSAKTDSKGNFEINKLPPGVYLVCASGPNGYGDPPYATHWFREKWFGNADASDAATPIPLREREVRSDVRITTSDEKRYRIIVPSSGRDWATAPERFSFSVKNRYSASTRESDGSLVIYDIPRGRYTLVSNAWSKPQQLREGEHAIDVADSDVTIRFPRVISAK
jgi:hypothetical protein